MSTDTLADGVIDQFGRVHWTGTQQTTEFTRHRVGTDLGRCSAERWLRSQGKLNHVESETRDATGVTTVVGNDGVMSMIRKACDSDRWFRRIASRVAQVMRRPDSCDSISHRPARLGEHAQTIQRTTVDDQGRLVSGDRTLLARTRYPRTRTYDTAGRIVDHRVLMFGHDGQASVRT